LFFLGIQDNVNGKRGWKHLRINLERHFSFKNPRNSEKNNRGEKETGGAAEKADSETERCKDKPFLKFSLSCATFLHLPCLFAKNLFGKPGKYHFSSGE